MTKDSIGAIIEEFEGFLDDRHITLPTSEQEKIDDNNPDDGSTIYGTDYTDLEGRLEKAFNCLHIEERKIVKPLYKIKDV